MMILIKAATNSIFGMGCISAHSSQLFKAATTDCSEVMHTAPHLQLIKMRLSITLVMFIKADSI